MSFDVIACPDCGTRLRLPADLDAPVLVCPKCQREIPNPQREATGITAAEPPLPMPAGESENITALIVEEVEPSNLLNRAEPQRSNPKGCTLIVVLFLVATGIAGWLGWAINQPSRQPYGELLGLGGVFVILALLGLTGGLLAQLLLPTTGRREGGEAGCVLLFLLAMMGLAIFVVFFLSCAASFRL